MGYRRHRQAHPQDHQEGAAVHPGGPSGRGRCSGEDHLPLHPLRTLHTFGPSLSVLRKVLGILEAVHEPRLHRTQWTLLHLRERMPCERGASIGTARTTIVGIGSRTRPCAFPCRPRRGSDHRRRTGTPEPNRSLYGIPCSPSCPLELVVPELARKLVSTTKEIDGQIEIFQIVSAIRHALPPLEIPGFLDQCVSRILPSVLVA